MKIPIIENFVSSNGRTAVENQFVIFTGKQLIFQSYQDIVAVVNDSKREIIIGQHPNNIRPTTQKYLKAFFKRYAFLPDLANFKLLDKCIDSGAFLALRVNYVEKYKVKYDPNVGYKLRYKEGK